MYKNEINILYGIRAENLNLEDDYTKDRYNALNISIKAIKEQGKQETAQRIYDTFLRGSYK